MSALPVAILLPTLVFAGALMYALWSAQQSESRRELQQTVHTLSVAIDRELSGSIRVLERIAESPLLASGRYREFHAYVAALVAGRSRFRNLVLFEPSGRQVLSALLPFDGQLTAAARPFELEVLRSGNPAISDVILNTVDGQPSIAMAVPVFIDGTLRGVLTARLDHDELSRLLIEQQRWTAGVGAVFDRSFRMVARSRDPGKYFGREVPDYYTELLRSAPRGVGKSTSLDGEPLLTAWETLPFGWSVAIGVPISAYTRPLENSIYALGALGLVLLALSVLGVIMFSRRVKRELADISVVARQLSSRGNVPEQRFTFRELDELFASLREASNRLAAVLDSLRDSEAIAHQRLADIEQADRRKDAFLAMLAHELRNPLAPIRTAAETLKAMPPDAREIARAREVIARQVMHLSRLVDDLLDVSRITQGKIALHPVLLDLRTVVSVSVHSAHALAVPRKQAIVWDEPREPVWVHGDLVRLTQIVDNLLSNALKFSPPSGQVNVGLKSEDGQAVLTVHDQGAGIPPELLDRVFDMFVQGDDSLERTSGGLGLGLTLVRELAQLHGGSAQAESGGRGQGATFTVRVPLSTRVPDHVPLAPHGALPASAGTRGRVLVVDDNQDAAEALAWILEPHHEVQIAYDGRAAVEVAQSFIPDVVLLDIGLPVLNGYQVAEELRKSADTAHAVIIAITGYGQSSDRERALQSGFDFHLVKPAEPTQVLRMIDDALQHRNESRATD